VAVEFIGVSDRLFWGVSANPLTNSIGTLEVEFQEGSTFGLDEEYIDTQGFQTGSRGRHQERVRGGAYQSNGHVITTPDPIELDKYLPLFMGTNASSGAGSTSPFYLGETLPSSYFGLLRGGNNSGLTNNFYNYLNCFCTRATISAAARGPMRLDMTFVGQSEDVTTQTGIPGGVSLDLNSGPYTLMDLALTVGGTSIPCDAFEVTIDNFVEVKFRSGQLYPLAFAPTNRAVTIDIPLPLGVSYATIYGQSLVGGLAAVATFTNSQNNNTFVIHLPAIQAPRDPLPFAERGILSLPWRGVARKTGNGTTTTQEMYCTTSHSP
jgi:tail tube protein